MTDAASELGRGDTLGAYEIDRELGRGGMGIVYLARHARLQRQVALKVIRREALADQELRQRFQREARIVVMLEHPHVVPVYDVDHADGQLFIAMRYVRGQDLATVLRQGALSPPRAARMLLQLGSALDAAHAAGLVHRDFKPANVLLTGKGGEEHAYLSDFGLTRAEDSTSDITVTHQFVGTVSYAAPEQLQGDVVSARTDVYALSCLAFEALTGRVPFRGGVAATMHGHLFSPPPSAVALVPSLPASVDHVLAGGLAKDPSARPRSAGHLTRELAAALDVSRDARGDAVIAADSAMRQGRGAAEPVTRRLQRREPQEAVEVEEAPATHRARRRTAKGVRLRRTLHVRRRGLSVGGLAIVLIAIAVWSLGARDKGDDRPHTTVAATATATAASTPTPTAQASPQAQVLAQLEMRGVGGSKAEGLVQINQTQERQIGFTLVARNVEPNTERDAYAVWLTGKGRDPMRLGFAARVGEDRTLATSGPEEKTDPRAFTQGLTQYGQMVVSRETSDQVTAPTTVVLRASLNKLRQAAIDGGD